MANTISYNMGQIRYKYKENNDTNAYWLNRDFKAYYVETTSLVNQTRTYQDILMYSSNRNFVFEGGKSYYLKIGIPRNLSYDMIFDLKLVKIINNNETISFENRDQYQEIKRFAVTRDPSNVVLYSRVVLYPFENGQNSSESKNVHVNIAIENPDNISELSDNTLFYMSDSDTYFLKKGQDDIIEINNRNDIMLNHIWTDKKSTDIEYFDFVFSNKVPENEFNAILLELNRKTYDEDISYTMNDKTYTGLYVDKNIINNNLKCVELVNFLQNTTFGTESIKKFNSIGVWSHPDSIMAINGEEIRIGQSGYYELNDFDISNFGIVVNGPQDRFSLDYQYKVE